MTVLLLSLGVVCIVVGTMLRAFASPAAAERTEGFRPLFVLGVILLIAAWITW